MRRLLIGLSAGALAVVGLAASPSTASARESHGHGGRAYHGDHGHRFKGGYYYGRYEHPRWERRVWDARCGRWQYCFEGVWYYYYVPGSCYYPITYCP